MYIVNCCYSISLETFNILGVLGTYDPLSLQKKRKQFLPASLCAKPYKWTEKRTELTIGECSDCQMPKHTYRQTAGIIFSVDTQTD